MKKTRPMLLYKVKYFNSRDGDITHHVYGHDAEYKMCDVEPYFIVYRNNQLVFTIPAETLQEVTSTSATVKGDNNEKI